MQHLITFEITVNHVKLIKMSMHGSMFNKVLRLLSEYLSAVFPIHSGLNNAMLNPHWFFTF